MCRRPSPSLALAYHVWPAKDQIRYYALTDRTWQNQDLCPRALSRPWRGKLRTDIAVNNSRLAVAAGETIYSYRFVAPRVSARLEAPRVHFECSFKLESPPGLARDVTSISFLPDGGLDRTLCVGYADGLLERISIPIVDASKENARLGLLDRAVYGIHSGELVQSLVVNNSHLLALSASGTATLIPLSTAEDLVTASTVHLAAKSWAALLTPTHALFGTSSPTPLAAHSLLSTGLSSSPNAILSPGPKANPRSPVYDICGTPPGAPWGASDAIVVSGWFDGLVRVHDLRSSSRLSKDTTTEIPSALKPVMHFWDPWSYEPIYAVAFGGGACAHVAAGSARHSLVAFWDVRAATTVTSHTLSGAAKAGKNARRSSGWSVYAPGSESSSPVYALHMESSRVFGATQSAPFVLDFGPGVGPGTYDALPPIQEQRGGSWGNPGRKGDAFSGKVIKYYHSSGRDH
jgi:WD40 repeat protein